MPKTSEIPGPGSYQHEERKSKGVTISKRLDVTERIRSPGPGAYENVENSQ